MDEDEFNNGTGVPKEEGDRGSFSEVAGSMVRDFVSGDGRVLVHDINNEFITDGAGVRTHMNKPYYKGQSSDPGKFKLSPPIADVFDLGKEGELERYNKLLQCTGERTGDDPIINIITMDRQFWQGSFIVYVTYVKYFYLLPNQS